MHNREAGITIELATGEEASGTIYSDPAGRERSVLVLTQGDTAAIAEYICGIVKESEVLIVERPENKTDPMSANAHRVLPGVWFRPG